MGILYLAFQAYPMIFEGVHHFDDQMTGLTFIGIGVGMFVALSTQPLWNKLTIISQMLWILLTEPQTLRSRIHQI